MLLLFYQSIFLLVYFISIIVKYVLNRSQITLHHANLFQHNQVVVSVLDSRKKSLFHLVIKICSFRVSSCDKKNLKWIFIPYMSYETRCVRQRLGDIKYITRFIIHGMEWTFIWDFLCLYYYFYTKFDMEVRFHIYWAKKESIHFCKYNHFIVRTKMLNSIRIYYSPLLSAME